MTGQKMLKKGEKKWPKALFVNRAVNRRVYFGYKTLPETFSGTVSGGHDALMARGLVTLVAFSIVLWWFHPASAG